MGKAEREHLFRILNLHLNTIHETFQMFDQTAAASLEKVSWNDVVKMGDQVSKQATIVGMLWTGNMPEVKALEENMAAYFNVLQGFLLLSHGSTVGAGPTLSSCVHASVKQVIDSSFQLMKDSISSYGSDRNQKVPIPQLVGAVWEACSALNKTPATNITAVGRAMTKVAVSVKDVLREMKELKPSSSDPTDKAAEGSSIIPESESNEVDILSEGDLGDDLSPEEMRIAKSAIEVITETLAVIKELIRSITGLIKLEKPDDNGTFVNSLEDLLKLCQGIGGEIDELGVCLYPPQEVTTMKGALEKISSIIDDMQREVENLKGSSDVFVQSCNGLRSSLKQLNSELDCSATTELEGKLQNIGLTG